MGNHVQAEATTDLSDGFLTREVADDVFLLGNGNYQTVFMPSGDGVVLIDAPEPLVAYVETAISEVTAERLSMIVYSHGHTDHIGAAQQLLRPGLQVVAEQGIADFLERRNDGVRVAPTRTFSKSTTLEVGSRSLQLSRDEFHSPEGDLVIYLPDEKTLVAIDILAPG